MQQVLSDWKKSGLTNITQDWMNYLKTKQQNEYSKMKETIYSVSDIPAEIPNHSTQNYSFELDEETESNVSSLSIDSARNKIASNLSTKAN